jgi:hypothetical protein
MPVVRHIVSGLSTLMGVWVLASFIGVMFNPGNAGVWTLSLVWSLLASLLVMPTLVVVHHANRRAERRRARARRERPSVPATPFVEDAPAPDARRQVPEGQQVPEGPSAGEDGPMAPA